MHPASIHLQFLSPINEQSAIHRQISDLEARGAGIRRRGIHARPDPRQLVPVEEVHPRAVAADVEVLLQVPALLEAHLREVAPPVVAEEHLAAGLEHRVDVAHRPRPLRRRQRGEDEDHQHDVDALGFETRRQAVRGHVPDVGLDVHAVVVRLVGPDHLDGLLGEVARVDLEVLVLVVLEDGEGRVPRARADLEERGGRGGGGSDACQDGEFLLQPLAVLEEVGRVVLVEVIPPLGWVVIESSFWIVSTMV